MKENFYHFVKTSKQAFLLILAIALGARALSAEIFAAKKTSNMKEPFNPEVSNKQKRAANSTAIIIKRSSIDRNPSYPDNDSQPPVIELTARTAKTKYSLCDGEPFAQQKTPGLCSAFLVAPNIVATAGHCVRTISACRNLAFVFGFTMTKNNSKPQFIKQQDLYYCDRIIENGLKQSPSIDFALIRLNRRVKDRKPLPLREKGKVNASAQLSMAGHPLGLPSKVTLGGSVLNNRKKQIFTSNINSYTGNSGSPVCSEGGIVEGILVRGKDSFLEEEGCRRIKVCTNNQCRPSEVVRSTVFSPILLRQKR